MSSRCLEIAIKGMTTPVANRAGHRRIAKLALENDSAALSHCAWRKDARPCQYSSQKTPSPVGTGGAAPAGDAAKTIRSMANVTQRQ